MVIQGDREKKKKRSDLKLSPTVVNSKKIPEKFYYIKKLETKKNWNHKNDCRGIEKE